MAETILDKTIVALFTSVYVETQDQANKAILDWVNKGYAVKLTYDGYYDYVVSIYKGL